VDVTGQCIGLKTEGCAHKLEALLVVAPETVGNCRVLQRPGLGAHAAQVRAGRERTSLVSSCAD